jgi:hypothetical protein
MASPFRYFRKHTKAFMAVAAVICMFLFVFSSGGGGRNSQDEAGRRRANATVATWNGGSLTEGQLAMLVQNRLFTDQFLRRLFVQVGGGQSGYDLPTTVPTFLLQSDQHDYVELQVINTELFASLAEQAGITVSDAMINHYIEEFGLGRATTDDIRGLLGSIGSRGDAGGNEAVVFSTLRKLLMAHFYERSFNDVAATVLPEQRWEDWRRINERISLQAAVLPTEKFLAEAPEPTEAQLKELYNQHKDVDPDRIDTVGGKEMPSPSPGFAVPRRVTLQYLVGNLAERTTKLLPSVTDEEIADYYERNKRTEFVKTSLDAAGDFDVEFPPADEGDGSEGADPTAEPGAEGAADSVPPETTESQPEGAAAEPAGSEEATGTPANESADAGASAAGATESGDAGTETQATGEESTPAVESPNEGDQSATKRRSPFRLAALQTDATVDETQSGDSTVGAGEEANAASVGTADAAGDASEQDPTLPGSENTATPATDGSQAADSADAGSLPAEEEPVEYLPLDDVRDEIRETLARDKAVVELERQIGQALVRLQGEYNVYGRNLVMSQEAEKAPPAVPEKLKSLAWLADEFGLEAKTTEPLTARELLETPVGMAADEQSGRINVTQAAFLTLEPYEPFLAKELDGNWYIVTKIADAPQRVPAFDEVRDQVAATWKRIEAAKLAEKKAKELAAAAEKSTEPFDQFFRAQGYEVVPQTAFFSWRNYALGPGLGYPAALSDIPELKNVGPEFMEAAFKLDGNATTGLLNYDHSAAYVIRLNSRQYTPDELKRLFLKEINAWTGNRDMQNERFSNIRQSIDSKLATDVAGFKFDEEWEKNRLAQRAEQN